MPWLLLGDINVTLKPNDHSDGGSNTTNDMQDFIDCVNTAEIDDLSSCGVFFTWIKSPLNPQTSILKKLDRAMVNEEFMTEYPLANAEFLPYMVSDHSPIIVKFPKFFFLKSRNHLDLQTTLLAKMSFYLLWVMNGM